MIYYPVYFFHLQILFPFSAMLAKRSPVRKFELRTRIAESKSAKPTFLKQ